MEEHYYKEALPQQTISRVRSILNELGIKVEEEVFSHNNVTYSCRIRIVSDGLYFLDLGTNGKGITPELALASGYAEFMERLQNRFIANEAMRYAPNIPNGEANEFLFYPDEKIEKLSYTLFWNMMLDLFPNSGKYINQKLCNFGDKSNYDVCYRSLPFTILTANNDFTFSTKRVRVPIVPIRANSSTGMCAGNTPSEAIVQGLCEIFERYALQQIWLKRITPPTINKSNFSNTRVGECLCKLEAEGYDYEIKDMSLGMDLPVMCLILTDTNTGRKMVRLGSDPDMSIALERCVTEIFQGKQSEINKAFVDYSLPYKEGEKSMRENYRKALRDGSGRYPDSLFDRKPTYEPRQWKWKRLVDSRSTLHEAVRWLNEKGLELYVRDNSFTGFCTYHLFVPGLSDQSELLAQVVQEYGNLLNYSISNRHSLCGKIMFEDSEHIWPLYNVKALQASDMCELRRSVEIPRIFSSEIKLFPYNMAQSNRIDVNLLLFMVAVKEKNYINAVDEFTQFLERRKQAGYANNEYLNCTLSYFEDVVKFYNCIAIKLDTCGNYYQIADNEVAKSKVNEYMTQKGPAETLSQTYNSSIVNAVCSDFSNPENVMVNFKFPTCFHCDECPIATDCLFENVIRFNKRINSKLKDYFKTNFTYAGSL